MGLPWIVFQNILIKSQWLRVEISPKDLNWAKIAHQIDTL